jgi:Zn-dependent peptidase ImmA (M78 family)
MNRWYKLSQSAAKAALKYRIQIGLGLDSPCDVYETIASENVELQFVDIPSLEGMCLQEPEVNRICVTAERPWGRQRFTAAHELGHYLLKHGSQIDTVIEQRESKEISDEEIIADGFARFLLMPPRAVATAFSDTQHIDAPAVFKASCLLGVGYESLVRQLCRSLKLISEAQQESLLRRSRQEIGQFILGTESFKTDVWPLDEAWRGRIVHAQLGDALCGVCARGNSMLAAAGEGVTLIREIGEATATLVNGGEVTIRASRRGFVGFYDYRYLPE